MRRLTLCVSLFILASLVPRSAHAQDVQPGVQQDTSSVVMTPPAPTGYATDDALKDWETKSRRARNALIGTAAATAVGMVIGGVGLSQCELVTRFGQDDLLCNNAGKALLGVGGALFWGGAIGVITSGILLGVRNKRVREEKRRLAGQSGFRWDLTTGRFVF